MTSIRIAVASLLAAAAMITGAALVHHNAAPSISHKIVMAGPEPCCEDYAVTAF
jgi:hypothetical protein